MERVGTLRKIAMSISGHRTESVYLRHDIACQKDLAIGGEKLEAFHAEQKKISTRDDNQLNDYRLKAGRIDTTESRGCG
jgi:hypothetical protein